MVMKDQISIPFASSRAIADLALGGPWNITSVNLRIDQDGLTNETIQFRDPGPQVGDIVTMDGMPFQILSIQGDHGEVEVTPVTPERIRGLSSNVVVYDEMMDMDPEVLDEVRRGFAHVRLDPPVDAEQINPAPNFMDLSYVNRPADRMAYQTPPIMP